MLQDYVNYIVSIKRDKKEMKREYSSLINIKDIKYREEVKYKINLILKYYKND